MTIHEALPWFVPTAILFVVASSYVFNRGYLLEVGTKLLKLRVFADTHATRGKGALTDVVSVNGGELNGPAFRQALNALIAYAKDMKPDWIVGVHPGGRLLSVLVCESIGLPSNRCLFVGTHAMRSRSFRFEPSPESVANQIDGTMLIVDDISRSGDTLRNLRAFINDLNYADRFQLSKVYFAVLLIVGELKDSFLRFHPNWVYYRTDDRYYKLPWSDLSARIATAYESRSTDHEYNEEAIALHERMISDFEFALKLAKSYVESDMSLEAKIKWLKSA